MEPTTALVKDMKQIHNPPLDKDLDCVLLNHDDMRLTLGKLATQQSDENFNNGNEGQVGSENDNGGGKGKGRGRGRRK